MPCVPMTEERRLADDEKPLLVQLNWNKDDREGRFLLRRVDLSGVSCYGYNTNLLPN